MSANVKRLINAGWDGIQQSLKQEPASSEDVINAAINMARQAIKMSCEANSHNRKAIRGVLEELLLETAPEVVN